MLLCLAHEQVNYIVWNVYASLVEIKVDLTYMLLLMLLYNIFMDTSSRVRHPICLALVASLALYSNFLRSTSWKSNMNDSDLKCWNGKIFFSAVSFFCIPFWLWIGNIYRCMCIQCSYIAHIKEWHCIKLKKICDGILVSFIIVPECETNEEKLKWLLFKFSSSSILLFFFFIILF